MGTVPVKSSPRITVMDSVIDNVVGKDNGTAGFVGTVTFSGGLYNENRHTRRLKARLRRQGKAARKDKP